MIVRRGCIAGRLVVVLLIVALASANSTASPSQNDSPGTDAGFAEDVLADNFLAVHQRAISLPSNTRIEYLKQWVFPTGAQFPRLRGGFQPPSASLEEHAEDQIVCPALALLDVAGAEKQLDELKSFVERRFSTTLHRSTFLFVLEIRNGNPSTAEEHLAAISQAFQNNRILSQETAWCYLLVGREGTKHPKLKPSVRELFREIDASCFGNNAPNLRLRLRHRLVSLARDSHKKLWHGENADNWLPTTIRRARVSDGRTPPARWVFDEQGLHDRSGSADHFLFYRIPLRGNFQISGETTEFNLRDIAIMYAGQYLLPKYKALRTGSLSIETRQPADPIRVDKTVRIEIEVRDGVCRTQFNGRVVKQRELTDNHNPWLAIRSGSNLPGSLKHLRITGDISVPTSVNMMPSEEMTEWLPYFDEKIGTQAKWSTWKIVPSGNDQHLFGPRRPPMEGTNCESLLSYGRPIAEDGVIEYEFRYVPDQLHVHPAIGTTAILLNPDGVKTHRITNGRYEQRNVTPDAVEFVADAQQPSLKPNAWNAVKMLFEDDRLNVSLNGSLVYSTTMSRPERQSFGLFRYLDKTSVRIRNLKWTGAWPSALPAEIDQNFAQETIPQLNKERDALADVFDHDFTTAALPENFFTLGGVRQHYETALDDGVVLKSLCRGDWAAGDIFSNLNVHGDFDITVSYDNVQFDAPGESGARLILHPVGEQNYDLRIGRVRGQNGEQDIKAMASYTPRGGRIPKDVFHLPTESKAGRLRIARRGNVYHYLFAEGDSEVFFHAGQETGPTGSLGVNGLHLSSMCLGRGTFSVRWKNIQIAAERLQLRVEDGVPAAKALFVMSAPDLLQPDDDTPLWRKYCEQRVQQFKLFTENDTDKISRSSEPVMVHHQRAFSDGLIYLWTQNNGRPVAIGTVLLEDENAEGGFREVDEFHSLHDGPLRMTDNGTETWNVVDAGITWKEVPDAPAPASSPAELFAQARSLALRFSSELRRRGSPGPPLLDEPIYEYSLNENGNLIAGILTAFSNDANPEVLLSLEVRQNRAKEYRWHFAGANYTGMNGYLLLDGDQVWQEAPARFGERSPHRGWFPHENLKPDDGIAATASTDIRQVIDMPKGFTDIGSPRWTPNQKQILFDVRNPEDEAYVAVVDADGETPAQFLGRGMMPAMSPDGTNIIFTGPGVMKMQSDGGKREQVDRNGWGVDWSPDGKHLAWGRGNQIIVQNVETQDTRALLTDEQTSDIRRIFWNHSWSPDSSAVAFKATGNDGRNMIAVARLDDPESFQIAYVGEAGEKVTWHPDNRHICFSMRGPSTNLSQFVTVDTGAIAPPEPLPSQPFGWNMVDADWSPDGRFIVFVGQPPTKLLEWPVTN